MRKIGNKLAIVVIIILSFIVWHKVLNQVFLGEGYYYFDQGLSFFTFDGNSPFPVFHYDFFARLLFYIFPPLFRDNIKAYMLLEFLIIIILYISLYTIVAKITKSKLIGFSTVVFFLANYIASFSLFAEGNYQRFVQRIPNLIPDIFSFYFLFKFYQGKKVKDYFISLSLYIISLLMGHFSSIILPLFVLYPLIQLLQENITKRVFFTRIITTLPFILVTFILTRSGDQAPTRSIFQFLLTEPDLLQRVLYQIPLITIPLDIVLFIAKHAFSKPLSEPYTLIMPYLTIICLGFYITGGFIIYKRKKDLWVLYLTSFLTMISTILLYMYIDTRINPLKYYGADRFFFIPSIFAAICWGIFLKILPIKKQNLQRIITAVILACFVIYNSSLIWSNIDLIQYKSETLKNFIGYVKAHSSEFNNKTIIVVPSYLSWPAPIITEYSDYPGTIVREFDGWETKYWHMKENVYVFDYEYYKNIDRTTHPNAGHMVDFTQKYRNGEKIQFLN